MLNMEKRICGPASDSYIVALQDVIKFFTALKPESAEKIQSVSLVRQSEDVYHLIVLDDEDLLVPWA